MIHMQILHGLLWIINKNYRNIDRETDVITFALEDDDSIYVITTDEIITLAKTEVADETSIQAEIDKKTQKK